MLTFFDAGMMELLSDCTPKLKYLKFLLQERVHFGPNIIHNIWPTSCSITHLLGSCLLAMPVYAKSGSKCSKCIGLHNFWNIEVHSMGINEG